MLLSAQNLIADSINIGLNYPSTGRYKEQGVAQARGALLAIEEINEAGGLFGKSLALVTRNTASEPKRAASNVYQLVNGEQAVMLLGGVSSAVAIAAGQAAQKLDRLYFGTLTYANATTGTEGHKHMFRETYNAWMAAKVLAQHINNNFAGQRLFYITADYTWGWSMEQSLRQFTKSQDSEKFLAVKTPFPKPKRADFVRALKQAKKSKAQVLVVVQFGDDMVRALQLIHSMGLKKKMQVIVPNLTLGMAQQAGPVLMENVIGAVPWYWQIPYLNNYRQGISFVEAFKAKYQLYPSSSAASAYSILYQFKQAAERAKSLSSKKLIKALEGHSYSLLKDRQSWRAFDHQNIQSVYVVKGRSRTEIVSSPLRSDYFQVMAQLSGDVAGRTQEEWLAARKAVGKGPLK